MKKILFVLFVFISLQATAQALLACLSSYKDGSDSKTGQDKCSGIIEVQEFSGCYCKEGFDLTHFNVIPTIDVAFDVALPILKSVYNKDFKENMPFKGYLKNDSIWVVYGSTPHLIESGYPYIEISKHDGRILKITHTK